MAAETGMESLWACRKNMQSLIDFAAQVTAAPETEVKTPGRTALTTE
jgi:hypothetical protein